MTTTNRTEPQCSGKELHAEFMRALRYAGLLGHEFVVLRYSPCDDSWESASECNSLAFAQGIVAEYKQADYSCVIFRRVGDAWEQVDS